jgi:tight adherence protein B
VTLAVGALLGAGLLLIASPWLWPRADAVARRRSVTSGVRERLVQAGLGKVGTPVFVAVSILLGVVVGAFAVAALPVPAVAAALAMAATLVPFAVVSSRARRRRRLLRAAWPDLVDHLVAGVRAGQPLLETVSGLAAVGPPEFRDAFRTFERTATSTGSFALALDELKAALSDPVADRIVETLRMSREVGGTELPNVLRGLAAYLRQEGAVRSEVEARQSWVLTAARLGVASPWIVLVLLASRPEAVAVYNSPTGVAVLVVGLIVSIVAYRLMVALGRLPEERRWFG